MLLILAGVTMVISLVPLCKAALLEGPTVLAAVLLAIGPSTGRRHPFGRQQLPRATHRAAPEHPSEAQHSNPSAACRCPSCQCHTCQAEVLVRNVAGTDMVAQYRVAKRTACCCGHECP